MNPHTTGRTRDQQIVRRELISHLADWLIYAGIAIASLMNALIGAYRTDADTGAYLDLSDAIRNALATGQWHSAINAYWSPLYPALLAVARSAFGFRMQYDFMAARLLGAVMELVFVAAAVALAAAVRRLIIARNVSEEDLLPLRTLSLWAAIIAYFFASLDLVHLKPDALVSS